MKVVGAFALALLLLVPTTASAQRIDRVPTPEPDPAGLNPASSPCVYEGADKLEREFYKTEGWKGPDYVRYPGACQRMRFSYGPIAVKPGQNDVLINPVTIEKPMRDGYITRFRPNLVRADGTVPPVEQVHLHHGTWISYPEYGAGPFFAAGEEKTVAPFPRGYGMPVAASDTWLLLYMVHSAVVDPMEVYIIYDVDFVPKDKGDALGMKSAYPLWLDVRPSTGYPVFNTQRTFGGPDGRCTWPREKCADFDPYGKKIQDRASPATARARTTRCPRRGIASARPGRSTAARSSGWEATSTRAASRTRSTSCAARRPSASTPARPSTGTARTRRRAVAPRTPGTSRCRWWGFRTGVCA